MDKRGISGHIDWILGVGLFLLSLAFIFVFFKPGVTPLYDSDTLLNVLQQGFEKDVSWDITKVPIFLSASKKNDPNFYSPSEVYLSGTAIDVGTGNSPAQTPESSSHDQLNDLLNINPENGLDKKNYVKTYYVKSNGEDVGGGTVTENFDTVCSQNSDDDFCDVDETDDDNDDKKKPKKTKVKDAKDKLGDKGKRDEKQKEIKHKKKENDLTLPSSLSFEEYAAIKKAKYIMLVGSRPINFDTDNGAGDLNFEDKNRACFAVGKYDGSKNLGGTLTEYDPNAVNPLDQLPECPVVYEVGTSETLSGVDLASVLALQENINVDELKESWGFPENKDFKIEVEIISGEKITIGNTEPPANVNVFVRSFNRFILSDDGVNVPIVVRILLW